MWESTLSAFLVFMACVIGLIANGMLLSMFFKRVQINRYLHFLLTAKAFTNFIALCNFFLAEIPNLIAERDLYPEVVFQSFGAIAGVSLAGRYYQFFISFGSCFISVFPLTPIPSFLLIISMILPPFFWASFFSMRMSSKECSYRFFARTFAWFYDPAQCAQVLQMIMSRAVQIQIICSCCFNLTAFVKLLMDRRKRNKQRSNILAKNLKKRKMRLIQCVAQDFLFAVDASFYFNESDGHGLLFNFFFNTYLWNLAHMLDGIIIYTMMSRTKSTDQSPVAGIFSISAKKFIDKTNSMFTRLQ